MPCNLNFNQCCCGRNFPIPIFTCRRNLIALLNQSDTTVVNPTVQSASIITSISSTQTVLSGGNVVPTQSFSQGNAISYDGNGTFTLLFGRYLVSYNLGGTIPASGDFSFGVYQNGALLPSSQSTSSGSVGNQTNVSNSVFVDITAPTGEITIKNTGTDPQVVSNGSIAIQKII